MRLKWEVFFTFSFFLRDNIVADRMLWDLFDGGFVVVVVCFTRRQELQFADFYFLSFHFTDYAGLLLALVIMFC